MELESEIEEQKINLEKYFKSVVNFTHNDNHECIIIEIIGTNFIKMKDYTVFYSYIETLIDKALDYSKKNYNKDTMVVHVNLYKTYIKQVDYSFFKNICPLFMDKYPDKLEKCIITNIPVFFKIAYKVISPWMDKKTKKKIFFEKKNKNKKKGESNFTNNYKELDLD